MNVLETAISLLAPHVCIGCGHEGMPVCASCRELLFLPATNVCYKCRIQTNGSSVCNTCICPFNAIWATTDYVDSAKDLTAMLKFQRAKAAAHVIGDHLHSVLPEFPPDTIISAVPTANSRVRLRGYDQARLIARFVAKKRQLPYQDVLWRIKTTRQVGANRSDRFKYLENAFTVRKPNRLTGRDILLIDDVLTTGATLESAAKELHAIGVKSVSAAVFAQAAPKLK